MTDVLVPRAEDFDEIAALLALAFHVELDPELQQVERTIFEPERCLLVRDGPHGGLLTPTHSTGTAPVPHVDHEVSRDKPGVSHG